MTTRDARPAPVASAARSGAAALIALACAACGVSCQGDTEPAGEPAPRSGTVELTVDLQDGGRWTMTGPLVDAGVICPDGYARTIALSDATTRAPLGPSDIDRRRNELSSPRDHINVIFVTERVCTDGSGSIVMEDNTAGDWTVVSGTGAYSSMRGDGGTTWGMDLAGVPEWVICTLELDLGAAGTGTADEGPS